MRAFFRKVCYRSSQFFNALGARLTSDDCALVESVLTTPAQRALFERMPPADQSHAVALLRELRAGGHDHPALLQAALLHDVAKSGAGITILHRVVVVLLQALRPEWLTWLASDAEEDLSHGGVMLWRRPFARYLEHPAIGARWAKAAGCLPVAVSIIRRHQARGSAPSNSLEDRLLRLLQAADDGH